MSENILLISEKAEDLYLLHKILNTEQFRVTHIDDYKKLEELLGSNNFPLILVDFDFISDKAEVIYEFQKSRSRACVIFIGEKWEIEDATQILQKGVHSIIPRSILPERIYDAIISGLENRKAFLEILEMMDELKKFNKLLDDEKERLRIKNQELNFINRLSQEVVYELNWDRILPTIIESGIEEILNYSLFCILYRIGSDWKISVHLPEKSDQINENFIKNDLLKCLISTHGNNINPEDVQIKIIQTGDNKNFILPDPLKNIRVYPLSLTGRHFGSVALIPGLNNGSSNGLEELMNTLSNILSLSIKNAQEYNKLRAEVVTDSLTGIYNRKGLEDFLKKEFQRAKRYGKSLTFVIIDMDNFKIINDSYGHQAGDHILKEFAVRLKNLLRQPDIIARYGGDEFAILLPETTADEAEVIMGRLLNNLKSQTFEWKSEKIYVGLSFGISNTTEISNGDTEAALIRKADLRLYSAKRGQL